MMKLSEAIALLLLRCCCCVVLVREEPEYCIPLRQTWIPFASQPVSDLESCPVETRSVPFLTYNSKTLPITAFRRSRKGTLEVHSHSIHSITQ